MRLSFAVAALLTLTACGPTFSPPGQQNPDAARAANDMVKLSEYGKAALTDIAVDREGTIHAVYREEQPTHHRQQIYYRASTDGGATWSKPLNLSEDERERNVGTLRLAIDGQGRVYALWWYATSPTWSAYVSNFAGSELDEGTLVYRVLGQGGWSAPVTVGQAHRSYSWFPAVDPTGQLHLVWVENAAEDGGTEMASRIMQARLTGEAVTAPHVSFEAAPAVQYGITYRARYQGLRGYVDGEGVAHWIASRKDALETGDERNFVRFDGQAETVLFPEDHFGDPNFLLYPPTLVLDAAGAEHFITLDLAGERPAVVDYALAGGDLPVVVREGAEIQTFQAIAGPGGKAMAFVGLKEAQRDEAADLHWVVFDGAKWGASTNLTGNGGRASTGESQTGLGSSVAASSQYLPRFGAGTFGPDGKAHLLIVNDEKTLFKRDATDPWGENVAFGGGVTDSNVFYLPF